MHTFNTTRHRRNANTNSVHFPSAVRDTRHEGRSGRATAQIVRLPLFRDGVFIGNEFIPISPRLRARIRAMAAEGRP